jgi:D-threo-aldose 1-dehydrogenase
VNRPGQIPQFLDLFDLDFFLVAGPYTLLEQTTLDSELERCTQSGVSLVIGAAFRYGILATGTKAYTGAGPVVLGNEELVRVKRIERVCEELGVPLPAAAIQFPYAHPAVRSVVFGALDGDQVRQTVDHLKRPVPGELWQRLRAEGLLAANAPVPSGA